MPELQLIKEFNAAPELVGKIYNYSLKKEYKPAVATLQAARPVAEDDLCRTATAEAIRGFENNARG